LTISFSENNTMNSNIKAKKLFYRVIFCTATFLCMLAIFIFSSQDADESSEVSGSLIEFIAPVFYPGYKELDNYSRTALVDSLQSVVRTAAHGTIYFALGVLAALSLYTFDFRILKCLVLAIMICIVYAVTDEIHQYFVPGRSMQFIDIVVDTGGAVLGAAGAVISVVALKKKQKNS